MNEPRQQLYAEDTPRTRDEVVALLKSIKDLPKGLPTLREFVFDGANLSGIDFTGFTISYCSFRGANLRGATLPAYPIGGAAEPDFTGALRNPNDAPLRGWEIDRDGHLVVSCNGRKI